MVSLTHNNHFKFGYNGNPFTFRKSLDDKWETSYGVASRHPMTFRDECKYTARLIRESTDLPICVGMSGGNDSEIVANSFISQGIKITPVIVEYDGGVNSYDTKNAHRWCDYRGIKPKVLQLTVRDYWKSQEAKNLALEMGCISPQFLIYMQIIQSISDLGGFPVFGSADCYLENNSLPPHMFEREKVASMYRYCQSREIDSAIGFFQYTPEIMLSFLTDPLVKSQVDSKSFTNSKEFKYITYLQHFDINYRKSTSGFEPIWEDDKVLRDQLEEMMPSSDSVNKHDYYQLVKDLSGNYAKNI